MERFPIRVACTHDRVVLNFREEARRDQFSGFRGIVQDETLLFAWDPHSLNRGGHDKPPDEPMCREWPFYSAFTVDLHSVPRFAITEMEAAYEDGVLVIELPPLDRLPWPKCYGSNAVEQWQRACVERLAWGKAHGRFVTMMEAADYIRRTIPSRGLNAVRPTFTEMMRGLGLPSGRPSAL